MCFFTAERKTQFFKHIIFLLHQVFITVCVKQRVSTCSFLVGETIFPCLDSSVNNTSSLMNGGMLDMIINNSAGLDHFVYFSVSSTNPPDSYLNDCKHLGLFFLSMIHMQRKAQFRTSHVKRFMRFYQQFPFNNRLQSWRTGFASLLSIIAQQWEWPLQGLTTFLSPYLHVKYHIQNIKHSWSCNPRQTSQQCDCSAEFSLLSSCWSAADIQMRISAGGPEEAAATDSQS